MCLTLHLVVHCESQIGRVRGWDSLSVDNYVGVTTSVESDDFRFGFIDFEVVVLRPLYGYGD